MSAVPAILSDEERADVRRYRRVMYLPEAIQRTEAKLARLREEAASVGHNLASLETSHTNGDEIATEYLKRLGYFR